MLFHGADPAWRGPACTAVRRLRGAADARPALAAVTRRHFG
jgi:hypothetical protein